MKVIWFSKRGIANVLGMIIVVGILFTAIIPLFLYVNQANNFYDETVKYMKSKDEERDAESLDVFAYPTGENHTTLNVLIKNTGVIPVKVMRIWVADLEDHQSRFFNETDTPDLHDEIYPVTQRLIAINISYIGTGERSLSVKLTTERGRIFSSRSNPLWITDEGWMGGYSTPYYLEFIFEIASPGWFDRLIKIDYSRTAIGNLDLDWSLNWTIHQQVHGDLYLESIGVPYEGTYQAEVWKILPNKDLEFICSDEFTITQYNPLRWIFIPADEA